MYEDQQLTVDQENHEVFDPARAARLIDSIEGELRTLRQMLAGGGSAMPPRGYYNPHQANEQAIEGVFDGEKMVDFEGKSYQVSANYASKSKLVEGDPLKLYITSDGKYFYKQLGPVPRKSVPGVLRAEGNHYFGDGDDGVSYSILTASVTYYMASFGLNVGDRVMLLLPADREAQWASIDNLA